jgi:hypothetical protein
MRVGPAASSRVLAQLATGSILTVASRTRGVVRVRRAGWIASALIERGAPIARRSASTSRSKESLGEVDAARGKGAGTPPRPAPSSAPAVRRAEPRSGRTDPATTPLFDSSLTPTRSTVLRSGPDGNTLGAVGPGATLVPLTRDRDWVRVRVEAWVSERDLKPVDSTIATAVSAADLRANPDALRGRIVRWTVHVLALQTADPLRKDLAPGASYFLARGPGDENALMYLVIPPALMDQTRKTPVLTPLLVTARIRVPRSLSAGVPILDLLTISK